MITAAQFASPATDETHPSAQEHGAGDAAETLSISRYLSSRALAAAVTEAASRADAAGRLEAWLRLTPAA